MIDKRWAENDAGWRSRSAAACNGGGTRVVWYMYSVDSVDSVDLVPTKFEGAQSVRGCDQSFVVLYDTA